MAEPDTRRRRRIRRLPPLNLLVLGFGFACACPVLVVSGVNLRLSDVACLAAAAVLAASLALRPSLHRSAATLGLVLVFSFSWIAAEAYYPSFMDNDPASAMILVRWLLAFPAAYWLCVITDDPGLRPPVMLGLILGWLVDTALLAYDYYAFGATGHPTFGATSSHIFWVGGAYRAIGVFGHPNGAAIASLYVVPFLIGFASQHGRGVLAGTLGWIATGTVFYVTRSRGATMAAVGLLGWWMVANHPRQVLATAAALALALAAAAAVWPGLLHAVLGNDEFGQLLSRFSDAGGIEENSEGRIETAIGSLQLAFTHPLGMGSSYPPALEALTGFAATHNALLQLAILGGLPLCLLCIGLLLAGARHALGRDAQTEDRVALYMLLVSLFEAHLYNPMTPIILLWLAGRLGQHRLSIGGEAWSLARGKPRSPTIAPAD